MTILALVLSFLKIAPEVIEEIMGVVQHAQVPANVTAAKAAVSKSAAAK